MIPYEQAFCEDEMLEFVSLMEILHLKPYVALISHKMQIPYMRQILARPPAEGGPPRML